MEPEKSNPTDRRSASWDVKNALPNYAVLVISQVGIIGFSFLNFWFLTRILGPEGYGGVVSLIAASQVGQLFISWTNLALTRLGVEEYVETGKIENTFRAKTSISLANIILLLLLVPVWLSPLSVWLKIPADIFPFVIFHFVVAAFGFHIQHALQGAKLLRLQSIFQVAERSITLFLLLILFFNDKLTIVSALLSYSIAALTVWSFGLWKISPFISKNILPDYEWIKKIVVFSLPLAPLSILGFFSTNYLDIIFISHFLTTKDVGIYSTGYQFVGLATNFTVLANTLLMPMFVTLQTHQKESAIEVYLKQLLPGIIMFWALYCSFLAIAAKYILPVVFGEKFQEAGPVSYVLLTGAVLVSPTLMGYSAIAIAKSMTKQTLLVALASASANVLFNYLLIPRYGLIGCAWATTLSSIIFSALFMIFVHQKQKIPLNWAYRIIFATLFGAIIVLFSHEYLIGLAILVVLAAGWTIRERKIILYLIRDPILKPLNQIKSYLIEG